MTKTYNKKKLYLNSISASSLQSSLSHDPSEIIVIWWFAAQATFVENRCGALMFLWKTWWWWWYIYFFWRLDE